MNRRRRETRDRATGGTAGYRWEDEGWDDWGVKSSSERGAGDHSEVESNEN